jgi:3-hydroxyisobutyrate dehydrogenase
MRAAVLGTGIMGAAIARNLARAGIETTAWNRAREREQPLTEDGVGIADSAAAGGRGRRGGDHDAVRRPRGPGRGRRGGRGARGDAGRCCLDAGQHRRHRRHGGIRPARGRARRRVLDAPVLGTKQPAEAGELIVLASGSESARDRCQPIFEAIGGRTVWLGEAGAGTRMKLVVNNWLLALTAGLAETVSLAETIGVDPAEFLDVIEEGGRSGRPTRGSRAR